jgi:hypothetical protein
MEEFSGDWPNMFPSFGRQIQSTNQVQLASVPLKSAKSDQIVILSIAQFPQKPNNRIEFQLCPFFSSLPRPWLAIHILFIARSSISMGLCSLGSQSPSNFIV